jgi:hypothetical protein
MTWSLYFFLLLLWLFMGLGVSKVVDAFTSEEERFPLYVHVLFGPVVAVLATICYLDELGWRGCDWANVIVQTEGSLMFVMGAYLASVFWWAVWLMP